jgi:hypothetical protein
MLIDSITYKYATDKAEVKTGGHVVGISYYNSRVEISLSAHITATSPFSGKIAATLTLANAFPDHLPTGGATGGMLLTEEIEREKSQEGYEKLAINAVYYPNVTAS